MGKQRRVSLVLGSGGARGLAHIGVIRCLEEQGFEIGYISGCSMGALVGGIHAAGKLDTYEEWVRALEQRDVFRLLDFSFSRASLFKGERIIKVLEELIGEHRIESLPIGYTAVAACIADQREIWFNRGALFHAIRASIAIPGIFAPVRDGSRVLVDGGLVNPLPIAPAMNDSSDLLVVVSLGGRDSREAPLRKAGAAEKGEGPDGGLLDRLREQRSAIGQFVSRLIPEGGEDGKGEMDFVDLMTGSMDLMQSQITRLKLAAYQPDVLIEMPRNLCLFYEFHRARELIDYGYESARKALRSAL
ncbi:MAG: patatin-like phospholipase family protein [Chromatiales bacterium]|nr:patatin-like phospholipase family protein [Chromatiales bacterium]